MQLLMKPAIHEAGLVAVGALLTTKESMLALQLSSIHLAMHLVNLFLKPTVVT
jgi:hypothetical protein